MWYRSHNERSVIHSRGSLCVVTTCARCSVVDGPVDHLLSLMVVASEHSSVCKQMSVTMGYRNQKVCKPWKCFVLRVAQLGKLGNLHVARLVNRAEELKWPILWVIEASDCVVFLGFNYCPGKSVKMLSGWLPKRRDEDSENENRFYDWRYVGFYDWRYVSSMIA